MARFMWTYKAKVVITPARFQQMRANLNWANLNWTILDSYRRTTGCPGCPWAIIWYNGDNWQDFNGFQTSVYTYTQYTQSFHVLTFTSGG
jgi:hypothetical protein